MQLARETLATAPTTTVASTHLSHSIDNPNLAVGVEEFIDETDDWTLRLDRACSGLLLATSRRSFGTALMATDRGRAIGRE